MKLNLSTYLPLLFLLALLTTACKDDTLPASPAEEEEAGSGVYVSVVVNTGGSNASRVDGATDEYNPTGGEEGDGEQAGTGDENRVHDLTVFFLDDNLNNATKINASAYFSEEEITPEASGNITLYTVQKEIEGLYVGNTYHVLVIANAGDLTNEITNIEGLKNKTFNEVIVTHDTEQWFLMASEKDSGEIEIRANNSEYNPTWVSVDVERMTARVDCAWKDEYEITGENMPSEGESPYQNKKDRVEILGAALVNRYVGGTFAFKRVTEDITDLNVDYLGDETTNENNIATNYVLDPKTSSGKNSSDYTYYYTEYANWKDKDFNLDKTISSEVGETSYYRLSYTCENINRSENLSTINDEIEWKEKYVTGIMYKALYIPTGFTKGDTFYKYNNQLYKFKDITGPNGPFPDLTESELELSQGVETFKNGICYYTYWIRHAADNIDEINPMEYAIVRNNIYQLNVISVSGLGNSQPENVEEQEIIVHFKVKRWNDVSVTVPSFD